MFSVSPTALVDFSPPPPGWRPTSAGKTFAKKCRVICEIIKSYCCFRTARTFEALERESGSQSPPPPNSLEACHFLQLSQAAYAWQINCKQTQSVRRTHVVCIPHTHAYARTNLLACIIDWHRRTDSGAALFPSPSATTWLPRQLFNRPHQ